jgi:hypothetical protein
MTSSQHRLALLCAVVYLLLSSFLILHVVKDTGGHFIYPLDDPYIHLALAENLAHGHYGINATEFSSPSSSILWPFLLIPFAGTALHSYVPLAWNLLFGTIAACLIGSVLARWPPQADEAGYMPRWKRAVTAVLLLFAANLAGLTLLGMEHVLQVLLAICCAIGLIEALSDRPIPIWCLAAAVLAPMVRYEDLALTLAVCLALVGLRQWKQAIAVFALSLTPLVAFSAFLRSKGLPLLPMSVLIKGSVYTSGSLPVRVLRLLAQDIVTDLTNPERYPILILTLFFVGLAWKAPTRARRFAFAGAALLGALQLTIGRFGWLARYEDYALIFLLLLCLRVLAERPRFSFGYFVLGLLFCASPYIRNAILLPGCSVEVFQQQYQMHRFVTAYYHGDYAVNDLGWVSFERSPRSYVLDLFGLASVEAGRQIDKSPAWLDSVVRRHQVPLAILYPQWFHTRPADWTPIARMCTEDEQTVAISHSCVVFYSTAASYNAPIRADLQQFSRTLPHEVGFYWAQLPNEETPLWRTILH